MKRYPIMYWYGPHKITETNAAQIAAAGFTHIPVHGSSPEDIIVQSEICARHGITVMAEDNRIFKAFSNSDIREKFVSEIADSYRDIDNITSIYITDEPSCAGFPALREIRDLLKKYAPSKQAYINLFPNYASDEQLGCTGYKEHIDRYVDEVNPETISYDHYHFIDRPMPKKETEVSDERERLIIEAAWNKSSRAGFFDNIEIVRSKSLESGIPFMVIVLLVEHGPYRNLSEAEIRWEVFQSLAYGSCRISYFTYMTVDSQDSWGWANGMQDLDGTLTRHYYDVAKINTELAVAGSVLMDKKSEGVYHIGGEPDTLIQMYSPSGDIHAVSTTAGLTLGFFSGGYILAANKDYISVNKVDITLSEGKRISVTDKRTGAEYLLNHITGDENTYTFTIMPGDGELLKII